MFGSWVTWSSPIEPQVQSELGGAGEVVASSPVTLSSYEMDVLRAAVEAEDRGEDPDHAVRSLPHRENEPARDLVLSRLNDRHLLDCAIQRDGAGDIYIAFVRKVLPAGIDALRLENEASSLLLTPDQLGAVEGLTRLLRQAIDQGDLLGSAEDQADLEAQVATMEAARRSPRPRRRLWIELLQTTRAVAEGTLSSGVYAAAVAIIHRIGG
jgi:hypothetical protein